MTSYVTVVYAIEDSAAFAEKQNEIRNSAMNFDPENPPAWGICASSISNEVQRVELIEDAVNELGSEAIDEIRDILGSVNLPPKA
ncbi:conserved hypothetical protein [Vibrio crassostreae]|nr:conserved hypothetical protein [Vibrio chagasii]CAK2843270.1 conserved hypothetical protein [Vibrio crassostreae]